MSPPGSAGTKRWGGGPFKARRREDCSLFDDGHSHTKLGAEEEEEERNPAVQTLTYEVDEMRRREGEGGG